MKRRRLSPYIFLPQIKKKTIRSANNSAAVTSHQPTFLVLCPPPSSLSPLQSLFQGSRAVATFRCQNVKGMNQQNRLLRSQGGREPISQHVQGDKIRTRAGLYDVDAAITSDSKKKKNNTTSPCRLFATQKLPLRGSVCLFLTIVDLCRRDLFSAAVCSAGF